MATAELYDPRSGTFSPTGSMAAARTVHTAALLADGRVLVVGGSVDFSSTAFTSAQLYDPGTGSVQPTGAMTTGPEYGA